MPLSLAMDDGEFDNGGGGGGGGSGGLAAAAAAAAAVAAAAVVAMDYRDGVQWRQWQGRLMAAVALVVRFNGSGIGH